MAAAPEPDDDVKKEFGARLARRRAQLNLTQEQAAQLIGITHRTYQRWEEGDVMPYLRNQELVAAKFEIPLAELHGGAPAPAVAPGPSDSELLLEVRAQLADLNEALNLIGSALFPLEGADEDVARFFARRQTGSPSAGEEPGDPRADEG